MKQYDGRPDTCNFSSSVQLNILRLSVAKKVYGAERVKRNLIYLQASMYLFVYYINILLTISRFNSRFKKRARCLLGGGEIPRPLAQLVKLRAGTQEVVSSTPAGPTLRVSK